MKRELRRSNIQSRDLSIQLMIQFSIHIVAYFEKKINCKAILIILPHKKQKNVAEATMCEVSRSTNISSSAIFALK